MSERAQLKRTLRPANVWAMALGTIIGFGCFVLPGEWIKQAGPMGTAAGLVLGGLIMLFVGKSYGLMTTHLPVAGGQFAYSYNSFGRTHAFVCGWFLTLGYLTIVPLNATALPILVKFVLPDLLTGFRLYSIAGHDVFLGEVILSSTAIIVFGYFNYRGSKEVGSIQLVMVCLLLISVVLLAVGCFFSSQVTVANWKPYFVPGKTAVTATLAILAIAPWAYVGFDTIPQAAEEIAFSPKKTFTLIVLAIGLGCTMYVTVTLATAVAFPWQELTSGDSVWPTGAAMYATMGRIGTLVLLTGVTMAIGTGINGFYFATSRLLFSMARAKVLTPWFARVHPKHQTPRNAILFVMIISLFAPWFGRQILLWFVEMSAVGIAFGYGYTCLAAFLVSRGLGHKDQGIYLVGTFFAASFLFLLCVPGMPAFMTEPSWIIFGIWVTLGLIFYLARARQFRLLSRQELDYLILGKEQQMTPRVEKNHG